MTRRSIFAALAFTLFAHAASAGVCDYKPSALVGAAGTTASAAVTGAVGGAGAAGNLAGLYAFTHAASGAAMLGSTAGGVSAAGTVGIMGGTAGAGAAVLGVMLNPLVWAPAAIIAVGTVAYEGGCYIAGD